LLTFPIKELAPEAKYPIQLRQAVIVFQYALAQGFQPNQIVLVGDSAGGNLIYGLISHMLHPSRVLPPLPELPVPLAGVLTISPWVTFKITSESMKRNYGVDCLDKYRLKSFGEAYYDGEGHDPYVEPLEAPENWWRGIGKVAARACITAGAREVMFDDIVSFSEILQSCGDFEVVIATDSHIHAGPQKILQNNGKSATTPLLRRILEWAGDVLEEKESVA
jgi:acetyl esterase/lipase